MPHGAISCSRHRCLFWNRTLGGFSRRRGPRETFSTVFLLGGVLSWATGSIYSKYAEELPYPGLLVNMQMLAGGAILLIMSLLAGEPFSFDLAAVSLVT